MSEFVVIVESSADARTATQLAERVLVEQIDWLETDVLKFMFQWSGLEEQTQHSCWKDLDVITKRAQERGFKAPRFLGHFQDGIPFKADGAAALKVFKLVRFLQKTRSIKAVLLIRDLDHQSERREGLEQAREKQIHLQPKLEIVIGTADRMREAWVLNGFIPLNLEETKVLDEIKKQLEFDPCVESHRLRSTSQADPDRARNPKIVIAQLTGANLEREQQCWQETPLQRLRLRGIDTGLTPYLHEIEQRLVPIIHAEKCK